MKNFFIIGNGSWGTAFGNYLANIGHNVTIYGINSKQITETSKININQAYFPDIKLNSTIKWTNSLNDLNQEQIIVLAISSQAIANFVQQNKQFLDKKTIILLSKGIDINHKQRLSTIINQFLEDSELIVISGPTHAEEVIKNTPTAAIIAGTNRKLTQQIQQQISSDIFKLYFSEDLIGVELAGALKNIIAILTGMIDGLKLGDNTKAAVMTKGMTEIIKFAEFFGAQKSTFLGLSGYGDLIVTCNSQHSRNRRFGVYVSQGISVKQALEKVGMVVEGYYTLEVVHNLANKNNIELPLIDYLYQILYQNQSLDPKNPILI